MKIYIAGRMTGVFLFNRPRFYLKHLKLKLKGYKVMNPAVLPFGFSHQEYMRICYPMIEVCDAIYFMKGWEKSKGALMEYRHARTLNKKIIME